MNAEHRADAGRRGTQTSGGAAGRRTGGAERVLYVDAVGGVAGDMLLAALIDAGAPADDVRDGLRGLDVDAFELVVEPTKRHGVAATRVHVVTAEQHTDRTWAAVRDLLDHAGLPPRAHARASEAFRRLAHAEARVHRVPPERVRFHEVGAVDALVDVCGVALALEALAVDRVACSALPVAHGLITAAHGSLPLPAPATLELLRGAPLHGVDDDAELVTPTGAALVTALAGDRFGPLPPLTLEAVGYGAGTRDLPTRPNVVRVLVGTAIAAHNAGRRPAVLVECTLDDLPGELAADAAAACVTAGALDAWITPVQMKKGRPGVVLTAIARPHAETAVAEALLRHTTTLGVRTTPVSRWELDRDWATVHVDGQPVAIKLGRLAGEIINITPEHDDVAHAAAVLGRPTKTIWTHAWAAAQHILDHET